MILLVMVVKKCGNEKRKEVLLARRWAFHVYAMIVGVSFVDLCFPLSLKKWGCSVRSSECPYDGSPTTVRCIRPLVSVFFLVSSILFENHQVYHNKTTSSRLCRISRLGWCYSSRGIRKSVRGHILSQVSLF